MLLFAGRNYGVDHNFFQQTLDIYLVCLPFPHQTKEWSSQVAWYVHMGYKAIIMPSDWACSSQREYNKILFAVWHTFCSSIVWDKVGHATFSQINKKSIPRQRIL